MEVRKCTPFDLMNMELQPTQEYMREQMTAQYCHDLLASGDSYCATVDGNVIACIGLINFWPTRRYVWAFLAPSAERHKIALFKAIRLWLKYHGTGRLESAVVPTNMKDVRFAERLGFRSEGLMEKWTPEGNDVYLYARIGAWPQHP